MPTSMRVMVLQRLMSKYRSMLESAEGLWSHHLAMVGEGVGMRQVEAGVLRDIIDILAAYAPVVDRQRKLVSSWIIWDRQHPDEAEPEVVPTEERVAEMEGIATMAQTLADRASYIAREMRVTMASVAADQQLARAHEEELARRMEEQRIEVSRLLGLPTPPPSS